MPEIVRQNDFCAPASAMAAPAPAEAATRFEQHAFGCSISHLYKPYNEGMGPAIQATTGAIQQLCPDASAILDLGSGHGEPGCTIATTFPAATVVCSDLAPSMLSLAAKRASDQGLANVTTMILDLADLGAIDAGSQDVVTANFALQNAPDLQKTLLEIRRVLKPGGVLVGTTWQVFSVVTVAAEVHAELMGLPPPDLEADKYKGSMRLADIEMVNNELAQAQFRVMPVYGHDSLGETAFDVGAIAGDAWKHVVIGHLTELEQMEKGGDATVQERTRAIVERVTTEKGYVRDGTLYMPGTFRNFRVAKPP